MKLLIAEDEAIIRMDLKETLQDLGYEIVAEARSGTRSGSKGIRLCTRLRAYGCPYGWR